MLHKPSIVFNYVQLSSGQNVNCSPDDLSLDNNDFDSMYVAVFAKKKMGLHCTHYYRSISALLNKKSPILKFSKQLSISKKLDVSFKPFKCPYCNINGPFVTFISSVYQRTLSKKI